MSSKFLSGSAFIVAVLITVPTLAEQIGVTRADADTLSRVAVGGDIVIAGNVSIIDNASLNVTKTVQEQPTRARELVSLDKVMNSGGEITSAVNGQVAAQLSQVKKTQILTPISIWLFVLAMTLVYVNRKTLLPKQLTMLKKPAKK
ncbi:MULTISPECIES: hypothetical protein [Colwellia]|uniref:Uncharacterized protein n=1 Tax=Colwellia marinimaniae TaxID=1513592 RepID=A0ABQ0MWD4_9GAMM|nr:MULTISPECIES: hypothetical protein [Colwellia]GAW96665.1 hypothetical protein MTCD1_02284 [Colwellia marinimaniae]